MGKIDWEDMPELNRRMNLSRNCFGRIAGGFPEAEARRLTSQQRQRYQREAARVFPQRCWYYARKMGVTYHRITIREQKTRWGSCSSKGNLNFNWKLLLAPAEVLDYVVVHELCHLKEMNHSPAFWNEVRTVMPDYEQRKKWLKDNGWKLMEA